MARITRLAALPRLVTQDLQMSRWTTSVTDILNLWRGNGNIRDKLVTVGDLTGAGGYDYSNGSLSFTGYDASTSRNPPAQVTNLVAAAGLAMVFLTWDFLTEAIDHYEVWRNTTSTLNGSEVLLGTTLTPLYQDSNGNTGATYYYWVRAVNAYGTAGPFNATTGTSATTAQVTYLNIAAGTITADRMNVSNLAAISANLGAITAGSLNINNKFIVDSSGNTTIQSATSGARLEITNSTIKVYDSSGTLRVTIGNLA